jgi:hypothetical protein
VRHGCSFCTSRKGRFGWQEEERLEAERRAAAEKRLRELDAARLLREVRAA